MTREEANKKLMEMERKDGCAGCGEVLRTGKMSKAQAIKTYGELIIDDEHLEAAIAKRKEADIELFGEARSDEEIRDSIKRENEKYKKLIDEAPETAEKEYDVFF